MYKHNFSISPDEEHEDYAVQFKRCKACQEFLTDSSISDEEFLLFLLHMYRQRFQPIVSSYQVKED